MTCLSEDEPPNDRYIVIRDGPRTRIHDVPVLISKVISAVGFFTQTYPHELNLYTNYITDREFEEDEIDGLADYLAGIFLPPYKRIPDFEVEEWQTIYDSVASLIIAMENEGVEILDLMVHEEAACV